VVASDVGGVPEIVRDGRDGILFPATDTAALTEALRRALGGAWDRDGLVRRARRFDWNETVEQALDELNRALKAHP
jgi:glycosyltransferase involved in cell wall biosynthesis